jgi:hypothetical protein
MVSFNAYGTTANEYKGSHKPVWLGTVAPHAVGGVLAEKFRIKGAHYPAGTPVNLANGILTPVIVVEAKAVSGDVVTIDPSVFNIAPAVGDKLNGKAITAVAPNATNASLLDVTAASHGATAGSGVTILPSTVASAATPNAYLYNDIYLGELSDANATGAAVDFHGEGILIDFTPAAFMKAAMKTNVPNVIQVEFPADAFVTE